MGGPHGHQGWHHGAVQPAVQGLAGAGGAGAWWGRGRGGGRAGCGCLRVAHAVQRSALAMHWLHAARRAAPQAAHEFASPKPNPPRTRASSLQEITTRDETGAPCNRGMRTTPFGQYVADGPPTCLSGEPPFSDRSWEARRCTRPGPQAAPGGPAVVSLLSAAALAATRASSTAALFLPTPLPLPAPPRRRGRGPRRVSAGGPHARHHLPRKRRAGRRARHHHGERACSGMPPAGAFIVLLRALQVGCHCGKV